MGTKTLGKDKPFYNENESPFTLTDIAQMLQNEINHKKNTITILIVTALFFIFTTLLTGIQYIDTEGQLKSLFLVLEGEECVAIRFIGMIIFVIVVGCFLLKEMPNFLIRKELDLYRNIIRGNYSINEAWKKYKELFSENDEILKNRKKRKLFYKR